MATSLTLQAIGSYHRINQPNPTVIAEWRIHIAVKVTDSAGLPVSGIKAEEFKVEVSTTQVSPSIAGILGTFKAAEAPDPVLFPGFYHLSTAYLPKVSPPLSMDWLLSEGAMLCLRATHNNAIGTTLVSLTPTVGST